MVCDIELIVLVMMFVLYVKEGNVMCSRIHYFFASRPHVLWLCNLYGHRVLMSNCDSFGHRPAREVCLGQRAITSNCVILLANVSSRKIVRSFGTSVNFA